MKSIQLTSRAAIDGTKHRFDRVKVPRRIEHKAPIMILGPVFDLHRHVGSIVFLLFVRIITRIEELSERLQCAQDTDRGMSFYRGLPVHGNC